MTDARVFLWGTNIGAVSWIQERQIGVFQFEPDFLNSQIEVAPLTMPLSVDPYVFPALDRESFHGLPGLLADSLPDKFGHAVIEAWLATQGRLPESFDPVDRLCYIGVRGMGALEFEPAHLRQRTHSEQIEIERLVRFANRILDERAGLQGRLGGEDAEKGLEQILRVGTSAGGARAKAVLAWNPQSGEFRSGQIDPGSGFEHWILKFDGISNNRDKELADPQGFGLIEYVYYQIALACGIEMTECRIFEEGGRSHFMTRRFDRTPSGNKLHMQSLGAIAHYDFELAGAYSYEQALQVMKRINISRMEQEQMVLRAIFNVVGRNQDDHVKNIAFLMDKLGNWVLSPAYDMTYAFNPTGDYTSSHQMSLNGKRDGFVREDIVALASLAGVKPKKANQMIDTVLDSFNQWPQLAKNAGVAEGWIKDIQAVHRLDL